MTGGRKGCSRTEEEEDERSERSRGQEKSRSRGKSSTVPAAVVRHNNNNTHNDPTNNDVVEAGPFFLPHTLLPPASRFRSSHKQHLSALANPSLTDVRIHETWRWRWQRWCGIVKVRGERVKSNHALASADCEQAIATKSYFEKNKSQSYRMLLMVVLRRLFIADEDQRTCSPTRSSGWLHDVFLFAPP